MAKKKLDSAEDPIEFTPAPELEAAATAEPAEPEHIEATLVSGSVDDDGMLTAIDEDGVEHKLEHGSFESLGNDRVRFQKK